MVDMRLRSLPEAAVDADGSPPFLLLRRRSLPASRRARNDASDGLVCDSVCGAASGGVSVAVSGTVSVADCVSGSVSLSAWDCVSVCDCDRAALRVLLVVCALTAVEAFDPALLARRGLDPPSERLVAPSDAALALFRADESLSPPSLCSSASALAIRGSGAVVDMRLRSLAASSL